MIFEEMGVIYFVVFDLGFGYFVEVVSFYYVGMNFSVIFDLGFGYFLDLVSFWEVGDVGF